MRVRQALLAAAVFMGACNDVLQLPPVGLGGAGGTGGVGGTGGTAGAGGTGAAGGGGGGAGGAPARPWIVIFGGGPNFGSGNYGNTLIGALGDDDEILGWTIGDDMPVAATLPAVAYAENYAHVAGGERFAAPVDGVFLLTRLGESLLWGFQPALPTARWGASAVLVAGELLVLGGRGANDQMVPALDSLAWLSGGVWSETAPGFSFEGGFLFVNGDQILQGGGSTGMNVNTTVQAVRRATVVGAMPLVWGFDTDLPSPTGLGCSVRIGSRGYVVGGRNAVGAPRDEIYQTELSASPAVWSSGGQLNTPRASLACVGIEAHDDEPARLYVLGGLTGQALAVVESARIDVTTGQAIDWRAEVALPAPRQLHGAAVLLPSP